MDVTPAFSHMLIIESSEMPGGILSPCPIIITLQSFSANFLHAAEPPAPLPIMQTS